MAFSEYSKAVASDVQACAMFFRLFVSLVMPDWIKVIHMRVWTSQPFISSVSVCFL